MTRCIVLSALPALLVSAAVVGALAAAPKEEDRPKEAKRVTAIVVQFGETYRLCAKEGMVVSSCFVPNSSAVDTAAGDNTSEILVIPKKVGVYKLTLTSASTKDFSKKETEDLTVVIVPPGK
jgi:hypothetical protein